MLLEQLKELKQFGLVGKKSYAGYPLKVEYFLTDMGLKMLSAIEIMQGIGIEYMVKHGMSEILDEKEFVIDAMHEKVSNLLAGGFHVLFYHIEM